MCSTFSAAYFCSYSVWVVFSGNGAWNFFIKTWPSTVCFKLAFWSIKWCPAAFADVGAFFPEGKIFAGEWCFRSLIDDDTFFFFGQSLWLRFISIRQKDTFPTLTIYCGLKNRLVTGRMMRRKKQRSRLPIYRKFVFDWGAKRNCKCRFVWFTVLLMLKATHWEFLLFGQVP